MKNFFLFSLSTIMLGSFGFGVFYFYKAETLRVEKRVKADECYVEELRMYLSAYYKKSPHATEAIILDIIAGVEEKMLKDGYSNAEIISLKNTAIAMTI